jgi:2-polyprenyl-3-methyl-5-hydroxy-6-metoxy-1,4-benzoquinol methylase
VRRSNRIFLEPAEAYDRIAPEFAKLSQTRRAYLARIEQLVTSEIQPGSSSLLDIGAGDGARAFRIVEAAGLKEFVLLEPSAEMRNKWPAGTPCWPISAEELHSKNARFDVITCLWNVLGHIFPAESRVEVLRNCARLLAPGGLLLIDISNRYNGFHYGFFPTILRMLRDRAVPGERNGDVVASWDVNGTNYATNGHVFTDAEVRRMASTAGLMVKKRFSVDYATGGIRRSTFAGHLLYVLEPALSRHPSAD